MKKLMAGVLAAASTTAVLGLSVPAANAYTDPAPARPGSNCPAYPPGQAYGIYNNPASREIPRGQQITLIARAAKGSTGCERYRVVLYTRDSNAVSYVGRAVTYTGTSGYAKAAFKVTKGFEYYWTFSTPANVTVRTRSGVVFLA